MFRAWRRLKRILESGEGVGSGGCAIDLGKPLALDNCQGKEGNEVHFYSADGLGRCRLCSQRKVHQAGKAWNTHQLLRPVLVLGQVLPDGNRLLYIEKLPGDCQVG